MANYDVKPRFTSTCQPDYHPGRPKGPSLDGILRKLLTKKITYEDPTTKLAVKDSIAKALVLRLTYNALQGEEKALEYIIDRMDGKVAQKLIGEGFGDKLIVIHPPTKVKKEAKPGRISPAIPV